MTCEKCGTEDDVMTVEFELNRITVPIQTPAPIDLCPDCAALIQAASDALDDAAFWLAQKIVALGLP